jgi:hypothetical protein
MKIDMEKMTAEINLMSNKTMYVVKDGQRLRPDANSNTSSCRCFVKQITHHSLCIDNLSTVTKNRL